MTRSAVRNRPDRDVRCTFAVVVLWGLAMLTGFGPRVAAAQTIRGVVTAESDGRTLDRVRITARDKFGTTLGETTTDDRGRFTLPLDAKGAAFALLVRRIGLAPTVSPPMTFMPRDTVELALTVSDQAVTTDTLRVVAAPSLNDVRYEDAKRRGWRVASPELVARHRSRAQNISQLLQNLNLPGLLIPPSGFGCVRSMRNNQCLTLVIDGVPSGTSLLLNPSEVYFVAVVSETAAAVEWGRRVPFGALYVVTRSNLDRVR